MRKQLHKMGMMGIAGVLMLGMLLLSGCKKEDSARINVGALKDPPP